MDFDLNKTSLEIVVPRDRTYLANMLYWNEKESTVLKVKFGFDGAILEHSVKTVIDIF